MLDIFHAILQKEYETQVSTAQPSGHQQLQVLQRLPCPTYWPPRLITPNKHHRPRSPTPCQEDCTMLYQPVVLSHADGCMILQKSRPCRSLPVHAASSFIGQDLPDAPPLGLGQVSLLDPTKHEHWQRAALGIVLVPKKIGTVLSHSADCVCHRSK